MNNKRVAAAHNITSAPTSHTSDLRSREKRYLWSMGFRVVCFLAALLASGPLQWVLFAAAVFLPYVAVLIANAGRDAGRKTHTPYVPPRPELPPGQSADVRSLN